MYCSVSKSILKLILPRCYWFTDTGTYYIQSILLYPSCLDILALITLLNLSKYISIVGQLPRVSGKDPERKEWTSVFETFFILCSLSANFLFLYSTDTNFHYFSFWNVCVFLILCRQIFSFYTVQYGRVQYSTGIYLVPRYYSVV